MEPPAVPCGGTPPRRCAAPAHAVAGLLATRRNGRWTITVRRGWSLRSVLRVAVHLRGRTLARPSEFFRAHGFRSPGSPSPAPHAPGGRVARRRHATRPAGHSWGGARRP